MSGFLTIQLNWVIQKNIFLVLLILQNLKINTISMPLIVFFFNYLIEDRTSMDASAAIII